MSTHIESPYKEKLVNKLQWQKSSNNCGPFTVAVVVNALRNEDLDGFDLAEKINKPRLRGIIPVFRRWPNSATFPWGMVDVFRDYDLQARWWFQVPISYLRPALANGHILMPIVGKWRPDIWAHVMTLVAWDPEEGWGFADTRHKEKKTSWLKDDEFQDQWKKYGRLLVEIENP